MTDYGEGWFNTRLNDLDLNMPAVYREIELLREVLQSYEELYGADLTTPPNHIKDTHQRATLRYWTLMRYWTLIKYTDVRRNFDVGL